MKAGKAKPGNQLPKFVANDAEVCVCNNCHLQIQKAVHQLCLFHLQETPAQIGGVTTFFPNWLQKKGSKRERERQ